MFVGIMYGNKVEIRIKSLRFFLKKLRLQNLVTEATLINNKLEVACSHLKINLDSPYCN